MGEKMELTCMLIKPDGVAEGHVGEIVSRIEQEGFAIRGLRLLRLTRTEAEAFYAIHAGRPFFEELVTYMTGGPIVALALEREDAVAHLRKIIGATDPAQAEPGTIRALFGRNIGVNTVHGSDSMENGRREVLFYFPEREMAGLGAGL
jgi:nucleoside-diphosphate kinase